MTLLGKCPIWGTPARVESYESATGSISHYVTGFHVESERAGGSFSIDKQASDFIGSSSATEATKAKITTWLVNERSYGVERPRVTRDILERVVAYSPLSVYERADRLLKCVADRSPRIGEVFYFHPGIVTSPTDPQDELLARTESLDHSEILYLLDYLESERFLKPGPGQAIGRRSVIISPQGYSRIADIENRRPSLIQGFVAMWFDPSMSEAYSNGMEEGISRAGYKAIRIDRKDHNNKIDDEIIAEIRRSRFLVADFTHGDGGPRGGVYYEAGFAQGLNIPVIYTCRKDQIDRVHFDTRQFNHILWENPKDLAIQLERRISATIGDGSLRGTLD